MFGPLQCTSYESDLYLQGDFFSREFEYAQMSFRLCDPARGEECADKDKIRDYFDGK